MCKLRGARLAQFKDTKDAVSMNKRERALNSIPLGSSFWFGLNNEIGEDETQFNWLDGTNYGHLKIKEKNTIECGVFRIEPEPITSHGYK